MYNLHLLQSKMTVHEYEEIIAKINWHNPAPFFHQLSDYVIARCPLCLLESIEKLDTHSVKLWNLRSLGHAVFDSRTISYHCKHFALAQPFINFNNIWPGEARGQFGPEVPHLIGHLLENTQCLAVIHTLPICRIEGDNFIPSYSLFMISYFSEQPKKAYDSVIAFNVDYVEPGIAWPFVAPPDGCQNWWDLNQWISNSQLYWVDADDPELGIITGDVNSFPYGNIEGRTWPYLHIFPYPIPKKRATKSKDGN